jgi:hypothetical protein
MQTHSLPFASLSPRRVTHLLLAAACCTVFAALTQAQSHSYDFRVDGRTGTAWLDTGVYLPPNTLLQISATGTVDVGSGFGAHGPEGESLTGHYNRGMGYPITPRAGRPPYGLIAKLMQRGARVSDPETLIDDWGYGEPEGYYAAPRGGHLWLTVNDDFTSDNTGAFKVHIEATTFPPPEFLCKPCFWDLPSREVLRGKYPDPKTMKVVLAFAGQINAINQSGETTLVSVSPGTVLAAYGGFSNLKVVFEKDAGQAASLSKAGVTQGAVFQNKKMSLITGESQLKLPDTSPNKMN